MSVYSGDFLGFQLGNWHSSHLNITRVSNGDRYTEQLTPQINNITTAIPGGNGTYYWDTLFTQRPFTIDFAFDDLRDEDIRNLKIECNTKGVKDLIFDETPYKKYRVVVAAPPTLKYIAFQQDEIIVYKGEGSINLVAYYPYAIGTHTIKIKLRDGDWLINNQGDKPIPLNIMFLSTTELYQNHETISIKIKSEDGKKIYNTFTLKGSIGEEWGASKGPSLEYPNVQLDQYWYYINSELHLIEQYRYNYTNRIENTGFLDIYLGRTTSQDIENYKTEKLYNKNIYSGDFLMLPAGRSIIEFPNLTNGVAVFTEQYY